MRGVVIVFQRLRPKQRKEPGMEKTCGLVKTKAVCFTGLVAKGLLTFFVDVTRIPDTMPPRPGLSAFCRKPSVSAVLTFFH